MWNSLVTFACVLELTIDVPAAAHMPDVTLSFRFARSHTDGVFIVDVKDFPPLPLTTPLPPMHSRVSSLQSYQSSGLRSSTPKVPPGFEHAHAHPPPQILESPTYPAQTVALRGTSTSFVPVTPAVPILPIGPRTGTPKPKIPEVLQEESKGEKSEERQPTQASKPKTEASVISLGSPKQRPTRQKPKVEKLNLVKSEEEVKNEEVPLTFNTGDNKGKKAATVKPGKIELPPFAAATQTPSVTTGGLEKSAAPVLDSAVVGTPGTTSQPVTPGMTTPSEPFKASTRPKVLRVLTTGPVKAAEQTPPSAATEKSSIIPPSAAKRGSRRPSLSSAQQSRPSTPAMSERPSHDASRAGSPPPSIIGSAPERTKSKAQQKKERKEKARTTEVSEAASSTSTTVIEEVAPVIARQKKQKKQRVESSAFASADETGSPKPNTDLTPTVVPEKPATSINCAKLDPKGAVIPAPSSRKRGKAASSQVQPPSTPPTESPKEEESAAEPAEPKPAYSVRDLLNEATKAAGPNADPAATHTALQKLLQEHVAAMPKIISSLLQSGDLAKDHPWLNPPSFNSAAYKLPSDARRGQEYLDGNAYSANDAFGYIYLPTKEKQALKDGNAVSVADAGERKDDLLKRCLVTPNGWVLRHLSADESEKVLELEERRQMYVEEFGEVGTMAGLGVLESDDFTNLGGGMERLAKQGERHNVVWILGDDGQIEDDDEFDQFDDEDGEVDGEIGVSDEEGEEEDFEDDENIDDEGFEADDHLDMPGAWEHPARLQPASRVSSGGRINSLPGLGPHSRTNALRLPTRGPSMPDHPSPPTIRAPTVATPSTANANASTTASTSTPSSNANLRLFASDALQKRVHESQRALEAARKDMEKVEKLGYEES